jgi:dUTP pyrophosphatase
LSVVSTSLAVVRLDRDLPMPARAHDGDAGVDLLSSIDLVLEPGRRALVPTGIAVAIPHGMVGLVHPRSGLATRVGLSIVNSPGTVDAGYRGEIKVTLINLDPDEPIIVRRGDRIAQLLVQRVELPELVEVTSFDEAGLADTTRGAGGHGSSGGHASL